MIKGHLGKVHFLNQEITFYDNILDLIFHICQALTSLQVPGVLPRSGPCCQGTYAIKDFDLKQIQTRKPVLSIYHSFVASLMEELVCICKAW